MEYGGNPEGSLPARRRRARQSPISCRGAALELRLTRRISLLPFGVRSRAECGLTPMNIHKVLVTVACAGLIGTAARAETDGERIQGNWSVQKMTRRGQELPENEVKELAVAFENDQFLAKRGDKVAESCTFTLDETKSPKAIDMQPPKSKGKRPALGIYKLEGDKLTMIWRKEGKERPTDFDAAKAADTTFVVLERAKK
jgi:uncharacterized protein (TIGR03067 family)